MGYKLLAGKVPSSLTVTIGGRACIRDLTYNGIDTVRFVPVVTGDTFVAYYKHVSSLMDVGSIEEGMYHAVAKTKAQG